MPHLVSSTLIAEASVSTVTAYTLECSVFAHITVLTANATVLDVAQRGVRIAIEPTEALEALHTVYTVLSV